MSLSHTFWISKRPKGKGYPLSACIVQIQCIEIRPSRSILCGCLTVLHYLAWLPLHQSMLRTASQVKELLRRGPLQSL